MGTYAAERAPTGHPRRAGGIQLMRLPTARLEPTHRSQFDRPASPTAPFDDIINDP
jgi:hypothetical protein